MKFLLDTNIIIYLIKQKDEKLLKKFLKYSPLDFGISSITESELWYGVEKSQKKKENEKALLEFLLPFTIVNFNTKCAKVYGIIRNDLEKRGVVIGAMDMLIASVAMANNLTLITNNEKEFKRIPNLKVLNWIK